MADIITEDYVSFETAKLLKKKGFDVETEHEMWYVVKQFSTGCHWNSCTYKVGDITREYDDNCCISMPTLQMAMKWLREVHNLYINIWAEPKDVENNDFNIIFRVQVYNGISNYGTYEFSTYEEACDAAIKYCLENLI